MTLLEITEKLHELEGEQTIYAIKPWSPESAAIVKVEPNIGGVPNEAVKLGMSYFLEVFIARDLLEDWENSRRVKFSKREFCKQLIDYAINDA